ncbi:MAG: hypothetical protein EXS16_07960 [Gemmataceae bacterium]|nr:hypothetical protein [Gemmataceae bacterium]
MSAKVHSLDRLEQFKAAVQIFIDKAKSAMSANALSIRREHDWLQQQMLTWKAEIIRAEDDVFHAKRELARRKMLRVGDRPIDTTEQEKDLRRAKARLAFAEDKRDNVKAWAIRLPDAVEAYDGKARPFQDALETDMVKAVAFLEHKLAALEEYQRIAGPGGTP